MFSIIIVLKSEGCSVRSIEKYLFQNKREACLYSILNSSCKSGQGRGSLVDSVLLHFSFIIGQLQNRLNTEHLLSL